MKVILEEVEEKPQKCTGWLGRFELLAFWAPCFSMCSGHRRFVFPLNCRVEKGRSSQNRHDVFQLAPFLLNSATRFQQVS